MTAVVLHNAIDQRQAQTGAFTGLLGGVEGLEHLLQGLFADAAALILDFDLHAASVRLGAQPYMIPRLAGIAGVGEQIDEHLHKLLPLSQQSQLGRDLVVTADLLTGVGELNQAHRLIGAILDGEAGAVRALQTAAVAKAHQGLDNVGNATGLLQNLINALLDQRRVLLIAQVLRQAGDPGDRVADFVGDTGREATDGGEALGMGQL